MAAVIDTTPQTSVSAPHRLRLIWQDQETRAFVEVGSLTDLGDDGSYIFSYREESLPPHFIPLAEFPDTARIYISKVLPAFFANRVMSTRRESYRKYLSWLGLSAVSTPMEILAVTGGGRATDTFHVVDSFEECGGRRSGRFFASGIADVAAAQGLLAGMKPGQELRLRDELKNPVNPRAILLNIDTGEQIGWVPDWLVDDVHTMREEGTVRVLVDQVNLSAPDHLKLICRLEATRR